MYIIFCHFTVDMLLLVKKTTHDIFLVPLLILREYHILLIHHLTLPRFGLLVSSHNRFSITIVLSSLFVLNAIVTTI